MLLYGIVVLVSALLGALAGMLYQDNKQLVKDRQAGPRQLAAALAATGPATPAAANLVAGESQALHRQLREQQAQLADLRRENDELNYQLRKAANPPAGKVKKRRSPPPAEASASAALPAPPVPAEPAADPPCLYASAVAGGFIRADQLADQAMHRMPLIVWPDAQSADKASFALNPGVDLNWLLEAGLDRLRDYFDYVPPLGRPTAVAAAGAGELRRAGEGWQVQHKAQLHVQ